MNGRLVAVGCLTLALVASAVATVYVQHLRRASFIELRGLEHERDALQVEWGQLRLEQSTWSAHERIERLAVEQLELRPPSPADVILVVPGDG